MNSRERTKHWVWLAAALALLGARAGALQVQYRVTDLGALGFTPNPDGDGTFGINDKGEVVYSRDVNGLRHAIVWLPYADYGLSPGNHDIEALFGASSHPSIAREINDSGEIAGQVGGVLAFQGQGVVWDLALLNRSLTGFLSTGDWSRGVAINASGLIVGESENQSRNCTPCVQSGPFMDVRRGFSWPPMSELVSLVSCPSNDDNSSGVGDISDNGLMVGFSDKTVQCVVPCNVRDAVIWANPTAIFALPDYGSTLPSEARGVSSNGLRIVGWGADSPCPDYNALFWNGLQAPFLLRANSRAEAVNSQTLGEVVGWELSGDAVRWKMTSGGAWQTTLLSSAISSSCGISLEQAHDINEDGWIVAWGYPAATPSAAHAYVLTPLGTCPADITGYPLLSGAPPDGVVNNADYTAVTQQQGPNPPGLYWPSDVNGDCTVNINDTLIVIANMGTTCP